MKQFFFRFLLGVVLVPVAWAESAGPAISRGQVITDGEKMADVQLAALKAGSPKIDWVAAVMWAGYADFSHVSSNISYANAVFEMGQAARWTPLSHKGSSYYADDLAIGQAFLDIYARKEESIILSPIQSRLNALVDYIATKEAPNQLTWSWCDSLFMAPPVLARLSFITHDSKYMAAADKEWWKAADKLYDKNEHLFFRDGRFLGKLTKNGKKVFWSRGNGWVFGGLARMLPYVPADDPLRARYVAVFQDMAAKLASLQGADGAWRASLLDTDEYPDAEMSGTALDCFAFAWGINNHLLEGRTYLPVVTKAWAALLGARRPDGLLGHVQGVGDSPGSVKAEGTMPYAIGAFLMAAGELSKLVP